MTYCFFIHPIFHHFNHDHLLFLFLAFRNLLKDHQIFTLSHSLNLELQIYFTFRLIVINLFLEIRIILDLLESYLCFHLYINLFFIYLKFNPSNCFLIVIFISIIQPFFAIFLGLVQMSLNFFHFLQFS